MKALLTLALLLHAMRTMAQQEACMYMAQPITAWTDCGQPLTDADPVGRFLGVQVGDTIRMLGPGPAVRRARLLRLASTQLHCPGELFTVQHDRCDY